MGTGDPVLMTKALANACSVIALLRPSDARLPSRLGVVHRLAEPGSHPILEPVEAMGLGMCAYFQGRWRDAQKGFERAEHGFGRCSDAFADFTHARFFLTWTLFYLGEMRTLSTRVPALVAEARTRGNLLALNAQASAFGAPAWLAMDAAELGSREVEDCIAQWPTKTFQLPHSWHMLARALIDLYTGDFERLNAFYEEQWPALARSGMLASKIVVHQLTWFRAAASVATATVTRDASRARSLVSAAERHARKLTKVPVLGSVPMAGLVLGAVAHARGEHERAIDELASAAVAFDALDMRAFAAAARRRLGELRKGNEGASLVKSADDFMIEQGVVKPARFARMLAAGYPDA
jgi:hypothetical protein